jgi:hypothetical protein
MYGFRHYFASNALGSGIPITGVAEWMGHKSIEETYYLPAPDAGQHHQSRPDPGRRPLGSSLIHGVGAMEGLPSAGGAATALHLSSGEGGR